MTAEVANGLPRGWILVPLEDVAAAIPHALTDGPFGSNLKTSHYTESGPRVIRLQNIGEGRFLDGAAHISEAHYQTLIRHAVEPGDIVIALLGEPPARACLAPASLGKAIVKADCVRLRVNPDLARSDFVMHALNSEPVKRLVKPLVHGVGRPRVNLRALRKLEIPVAPAGEQERIIAALDQHSTRLDAAVHGLFRAQANLTRYRASVLKAAVEGRLVPTEAELAREEGRDYEPAKVLLDRILAERRRLWEEAELARLKARAKRSKGDGWKSKYKEPVPQEVADLPALPDGWCWSSVGQIGEVSGGLTKNAKRDAYSLRLPYLRVANVYANQLELGEVKTIGVRETELEKVLLKEGDLLVVEGNGSVDQIGRVAIWDGSIERCAHQNHLIKVRFQDARIATWVLCWLLSPNGRRHVVRVASSTSGLHTLSISKVSNLPVPLPPQDEQGRIVDEFERLSSVAVAVENELSAGLSRCDHLRNSVLGWAFSGKLVDQDAQEEPAAELLARIAEQRDERKPRGKRKR